jgi:hypothetical protein
MPKRIRYPDNPEKLAARLARKRNKKRKQNPKALKPFPLFMYRMRKAMADSSSEFAIEFNKTPFIQQIKTLAAMWNKTDPHLRAWYMRMSHDQRITENNRLGIVIQHPRHKPEVKTSGLAEYCDVMAEAAAKQYPNANATELGAALYAQYNQLPKGIRAQFDLAAALPVT